MRDCQPLPVARNLATTSGDSRMVIRSLVTSAFGLPNGRSFRNSLSVSSRASGSNAIPALIFASSSSEGSSNSRPDLDFICIKPHFSSIGFSEADNSQHLISPGKNNAVNASANWCIPDHPALTIIISSILYDPYPLPFNELRVGKRNTVLCSIYDILPWVKLNLHMDYCTYRKSRNKSRRPSRSQVPDPSAFDGVKCLGV